MKKEKTILIVEDNTTTRKLLEKIFEKSGYETLQASNGEEALDIIEKNSVDMVTLDADMPVMDGFLTCEKIRANTQTSGLPVIMITAYNSADEIERGFKAGVSEYLIKPIKKDELLTIASVYTSIDSDAIIGRVAVLCREATLRSIVESALRQNRFTPIFFDSIKELSESEDEFEMIIIDIPEEETDIKNILQRVNQKRKGTPIILLSSITSSETVVNAYMYGASDYMLKPFETKVLSAKILSLYRANKYKNIKEEIRIKNSRIELLKELYVSLSHHINNILCSLSLRVEHLLLKIKNKEQISIVNDIKEDTKKIESVIEKLEEISKNEDIPLETYLDDTKMIKL